ncbi:hypothetical protein [Longimicrobium sp.]|uniref:hypothetical protein n=1 Tax=Longimicrobium sp. TaxID=2029185 RepID=UPI002E2F3052|nr:hypothetical protein [Longimicrobium sp.]HEX6041349.1 hypothetical protein [Longimicrobium sp.]
MHFDDPNPFEPRADPPPPGPADPHALASGEHGDARTFAAPDMHRDGQPADEAGSAPVLTLDGSGVPSAAPEADAADEDGMDEDAAAGLADGGACPARLARRRRRSGGGRSCTCPGCWTMPARRGPAGRIPWAPRGTGTG